MENRTPRIAVVEHASEQGFWRIDVLAPTERLVPFMRRFNAYAEHETGFVRGRELPSGAAFLELDLGSAAAASQCRTPRGGLVSQGTRLSRKHHTLCFRREFGMPLKLSARILRFDHAIRLLGRDQVTSCAELAAACGYADQAHLTRDFRSFAGSPPASFMRGKLPDEGGCVDYLLGPAVRRGNKRSRRTQIRAVGFGLVQKESKAMSTPKPKVSTEVIPYIFYRDVPAALDWLARAFGFTEELRHATPGGMHAQMTLDRQRIMMGQGSKELGMLSPHETKSATQGIFVYLADVDAHYERARAAGAEIVHPPRDESYGRTYTVRDIDGHPWFFTSPPAER